MADAQATVAAAAATPAVPPMTAEEALRQAEAEGLRLLKSESSNTGYKGVAFDRRSKTRPYHTQAWRGGEQVTLGYFATAEEAALSYARTPEARAAIAAGSSATATADDCGGGAAAGGGGGADAAAS